MVLGLKRNKLKILVADDEASIRRILNVRLSLMGYEVLTAADGEEALDIFRDQDLDMVVLDVMMPKLDGFRTCQTLREASEVPIIMLTALTDVADRISGLELGADDYMVKPFSLKELEARIRCVLRRKSQAQIAPASAGKPRKAGVHKFGLLQVDANRRQVHKGTQRLKLTELEFDLLEMLARCPEKPVSRNVMLEKLWGFVPERYDDRRVVDVHISRLRQKLNAVTCQRELITSIRGVGYVLQVSQ